MKKADRFGFRIDSELKNFTEKVIKHLNSNKTDFLEKAIRSYINELSKKDAKIKKMVDDTRKNTSIVD